MKFIQIKKYKTYEYKSLTIGIWKTANKSFIKESYFAPYLEENKYLSDEGKKISKKFKYLYFWDFISADGNSFNNKFDNFPPVFSIVDSYRPSEEEALNKAKKTIDRELERIEWKKLDLQLPTHFYNRSSGKVIRISAVSNKKYDQQKSQVSFSYCGSRFIISV